MKCFCKGGKGTKSRTKCAICSDVYHSCYAPYLVFFAEETWCMQCFSGNTDVLEFSLENSTSLEAKKELDFLFKSICVEDGKYTFRPEMRSLVQNVVFMHDADIVRSGRHVCFRQSRRDVHGKTAVPRIGVFARESVCADTLLFCVYGTIYAKKEDSLVIHPSTVSEFVYFLPGINLFVDGSKLPSMLCVLKRSCRANCEVKLVVSIEKYNQMSRFGFAEIGVFSRSAIKKGEELFLRHDYYNCNTGIVHFCFCYDPEKCVSAETAKTIE